MLGTARTRAIIGTALCSFSGALLLPLGLRAVLPIPQALLAPLLAVYVLGAALITLVVAVTAWVALWPATPYLELGPEDPEPRGAEPREAKAAALSFPARIATAGTGVGELAVAAGWLALTVTRQPVWLLLSLSLTTAVLVGLGWLLLYSLGRQAVAPLLHRLRDVGLGARRGPAQGGGLLSVRLGYALFIVVAAGLTGAGVFGSAYLLRFQDGEARAARERLGFYLAQSTRGLSAPAAQLLCETLPLSAGPLSLVPAAESAGAVAHADGGPVLLATGQRVYLPRERSGAAAPPLGMLLGLTALLLLCAALAFSLGGDVSRDVLSLVTQVRALAETQAGLRTRLPGQRLRRTAEAQRVAEALERLLDRMRRLHVQSYLTIERTIEARRAKSQFLASMSHDLRSPLTSILGFAELLLNGYEGPIPEAAARRLGQMHKSGRRLLRLLSEILDTAKVESQTIELHPRPCAPAELLAQAVSEARRGRGLEEVPIQLEAARDLRPAFVDPLRFPQALVYLISHVLDGVAGEGVRHDTRGQDYVRVSAREEQDGDRGAALVVDIEHMRARSRVAEPPLPLGTVGLGLALPLARRLIALHGGRIEISPGPRPGLRAIVPNRAKT